MLLLVLVSIDSLVRLIYGLLCALRTFLSSSCADFLDSGSLPSSMFADDRDEVTREESGSSYDVRVASSRTSSGLSTTWFKPSLLMVLLSLGVLLEVASCLPSTLSL